MEKTIRNKFSKRKAVLVKCTEELLTQQHFQAETNINLIMEKYNKTGMLPVRKLNPHYGDFSKSGDYQEALNNINDAKEEFSKLPAEVKRRFGQNPVEIIQFLLDKNNQIEAEKMGLIEKKVQPLKKGEPTPEKSKKEPDKAQKPTETKNE